MKKITRFLCLTFLALTVTSCHPVTGLEMCNNTGGEITVVSIDSRQQETTYLLKNGECRGIKVGFQIRIKNANEIWDYDFPPPPDKKFLKRVAMNVFIERMQIEKGGVVYEIAPDSPVGPVTAIPVQPPGYPVKPKQVPQ